MYSFINIATVVRDLARHGHGVVLVDDLLRAFAVGSSDLNELEGLPRNDSMKDRRDRALAMAQTQPHALAVLAAARSAAADDGLPGYVDALPALESAPLFGLEALCTFVRAEVLADAWQRSDGLDVARHPRALDIVTDGLVGSWAGDDVLAAPWREYKKRVALPRTSASYDAVFDATRQLAARGSRPDAPANWPALMHDACWAVHLTGRGRTAAIAQLMALRIVLDAGKGSRPSFALVAVVSAAIHATSVSDLIATETHQAMTQPLLRSLN